MSMSCLCRGRSVIAQSEYLMDTARDFRLKLKIFSVAKSKGGKAALPPAPTHATVYVAVHPGLEEPLTTPLHIVPI